MTTPTSPDTPNFTLAEGFELPPSLDAQAMRIVKEVFSLEHYTFAPLIPAEVRDEVFGHPYPQRPVGGFACNGFVINTLEQTEEGIVADTIVAPSPGMDERDFLRFCLDLNMPVMPEADFKDRAIPLRDLVAALGHTGIPAATGVHISVGSKHPDTSFGALILPRVYITEFGARQSVDSPDQYGIKTCSSLFYYLTKQQLDALGT